MGRDAGAHRIDDRVSVIGGIEKDLAADGRDAKRVPIAADAGDNIAQQILVPSAIEWAEPQCIEDRHWSGAHREDVAHDSAHAGRGALVRLDRARMVVRFDLEDHCQSVADIDRARVFPGPWRTQGASVGSVRRWLAECL